jgi:hypothetical protein
MEDARLSGHKREFTISDVMNTTGTFPAFDDRFPELNKFILELVKEFEVKQIRSWDDLKHRVNVYFRPERLDQIDSMVPGWKKMSSYSDGVTLVHVMSVFLGLFMLPEFKSLPEEQQQLAKWIVLFHDVEKEITEGARGRDKTHAFRGAVSTAWQLPSLGFRHTAQYENLVSAWSVFTDSAMKISQANPDLIQDNQKLPAILSGIERMFGHDTPVALIVKGVLFHMSINVVREWPQAAPMTAEEIKHYIDRSLLPLLKVMMLADNEGWSIFYPDARAEQRQDTLAAFEEVENLIS